MTYVQKKTRMFMNRGDWLRPERRRSESRLKTYPSSTDIRNWCDVVEDRRQHILELVVKGFDKCTGKLIPLDVLMEMLMAMMGTSDASKLKKCLEQLWDFIASLNLPPKDAQKFKKTVVAMDMACKENMSNTLASKYGLATSSDECEPQCVASERHSKERAEIEAFVNDALDKKPTKSALKSASAKDTPTIEAKMSGPGKMVTRIKGLQPGFQVVDDPSNPSHVTIKPSKRSIQSKSTELVTTSPQVTPNPSVKSKGSEQSVKTTELSIKASTPSAKASTPSVKGSQPSAKGFQPSAQGSQPSAKDSRPVISTAVAGDGLSPDKVAAMEALCNEQRDKIEALTKERDDLKTKLDACLKELDNFKKLQTVANPTLPASCQQEIEALEAEIKIMRKGNPSPEEEAEIIKKEVDILKRYCSKLKEVESENEKLKVELGSRVAIKDSEPAVGEKVDTLKDKLKNLEDLTKERDDLANKVHLLENQLKKYQGLPADIDDMRNKSQMLDGVMKERDSLSQKCKVVKAMEEEIKKLRAKADRVDELEKQLRNASKGDLSSGLELKKTQSRAGNLEIELRNTKCERDAMKKRIENMKKEMDSQKAKATEAEMLRLERDRLQIKLNELSDIQTQYEDTMNKMKVFDTIKAERDMYKQKYEEVLDMECKCEMLKAQVDEARAVGRERDQLQKQVQDLEACICEQEDEIRGLVVQVDKISKSKNDSNNRMNNYKEEMAIKDRLLQASQDKLAQSQTQSTRIKELEKQLHNAEHSILQKDCHIKCLENQLNCKSGSLNAGKTFNKREMDSIEQMRRELEAAKAENKRLQDIAKKMMSISGDDHVKKMLQQSECAVKRVVQELGKQYKEWDTVKTRSPKGKFGSNKMCLCQNPEEVSSGDDCEMLRHELEELQKEKLKLEVTVKQLQSESRSGKMLKCPSYCR